MKTIIVIALSFVFASCDKITNDMNPKTQNMRFVASNPLADVYVVNIDGRDYILVTGVYKAAICPASK